MSAPVVDAGALSKNYTFHEQEAGLRNAVRSLFHRTYQTRVAVDDITFAIDTGEIVGLLGRNGAGKTTTLKMLCGLLRPTAGELRVLGHEPVARSFAFRSRISVVLGQKSMLWWDVPAMESFLVHKQIYALRTKDFDDSVRELAAMLGIDELLHVPVRKLSLGERMRCELMLALLHRPDVLFLDEPTIGLDVLAKVRVREFLAQVNEARGTTILLTSHDMDDVEALCPRVMLIDHGRLRYDGALADLVQSMRPLKRVRVAYTDNRVQTFEVERAELGELLARLGADGDIADLDVSDASLEEIMRDVFIEADADGALASVEGGERA
ncbi:MAG TPA: ATP-binding cassette domain-containing protein [Actinopolymorphaceae bacterium]